MARLPEYLPDNLFAGYLNKIFNGGSTAKLEVNIPRGGCGGCPTAGSCGTCPLRSIVAKSKVLVFNPSQSTVLERVITKAEVMNTIPYRLGAEATRPVPSKKTCSQCGKNPTTCHCEGNLEAA